MYEYEGGQCMTEYGGGQCMNEYEGGQCMSVEGASVWVWRGSVYD